MSRGLCGRSGGPDNGQKSKVRLAHLADRSFDPAFDVSRRAAAESGRRLRRRRLFAIWTPTPPRTPPHSTHEPTFTDLWVGVEVALH